MSQAPSAEAGRDVFRGIRYPIACWLDDTFIFDPDSPWRSDEGPVKTEMEAPGVAPQQRWKDHTFEWDLFRDRNRAEVFWEQARLAEKNGDIHALEVFYLCVLLGFRGELRNDVQKLQRWKESVGAMLGLDQARDWTDKPQELPGPETNVPPLTAKDRLMWLIIAWIFFLGVSLAAIPILTALK